MPIDVTPGGIADGENFFGRDKEIADLWDNIDRKRNLLLVSPRRVGKTSLLQYLVDHPRGGWTVIFVDFQIVTDAATAIELVLDEMKKSGTVGSGIFKAFVEKLQAVENIQIGVGGASVGLRQAAGRNWASTTSAFIDALLASAKNGTRLLLIIDEFPILVQRLARNGDIGQAEDLLRLFRAVRLKKGLLENVRMIVCGSIGLKPVLRRHKISADANDLKDFLLGPWSEKTARAFLDAIAKSRPNLDLPAQLRDEILACTGATPLPYHLQSILSQIDDLKKAPSEVTSEDVTTARDRSLGNAEFDHYYERLEAVFEPEELEMALAILSALATRDEGRLSDIDGLPPGRKPVNDVIRTLLEDGYIIKRKDRPGEPVYAFSNPMLCEFWASTHA